MEETPVPLGLYVHLPFCVSRCGYCDFAVVTDRDESQGRYVDCLLNEVSYWSSRIDRPFTNLYFGGGTPSRLDLDLWRRLFEAITERMPGNGPGCRHPRLSSRHPRPPFRHPRESGDPEPGLHSRPGFPIKLGMTPSVEITAEANPESLTSPLLETWASLGINRISLGVQSFNSRFLSVLERRHTETQAREAARNTRSSGFENWSLDLIYGLPGQTLEDWQEDVRATLELDPPHISFYNLILHPNLPVTRKALDRRTSDEEDLQSEMFLFAIDCFESNGYEVYELSNAAKPGKECRHNLLYWTGGEWIGAGMSGSSFLDGAHLRNPSRWDSYLEKWGEASGAPVWNQDKASRETQLLDTIMLRLRTRWGIAFAELERLIESPLPPSFRSLYQALGQAGYLQGDPDRLALSPKGWLVHSEITNRVVDSLRKGG